MRHFRFVERICFARVEFDGNGLVELDRKRKFLDGSLGFVVIRRREEEEEDQFLKCL